MSSSSPSSAQPGPVSRLWAYPKALIAIYLALGAFALIEVALQTRAYLRTGSSVFARMQGESAYVFHPDVGLTLLRPNHVSGGSEQEIRSNRLGLRGPDVSEQPMPGVYRIAVLGASTVMGAFAARNELTFPALLEAELNRAFPSRRFEVINAGMTGFTLRQQSLLFDRVVSRLRPDLTIVYPGFNEFASYCRNADGHNVRWTPQPLVQVRLPAWWLSAEVLLKNTVALRTLPPGLNAQVDPLQLDLSEYRQTLGKLLTSMEERGAKVLMVRNAKSFRRDQPRDVQERLSEGTRFHKPCFDVEGLHVLYERHNAAISEMAQTFGVSALPLDEALPGGTRYFADASHFSALGEQFVAQWLAKDLAQSGLLDRDRAQ